MTPADEQRMRFVFALRQRGVMDARVLEAMEKIDRGAFVKGIFADRAYEDMPLPIACGQTISQPSVVGLMTQALQVEPRHKVLEIGTGSGYQAAILSQLARRVYSVDRHKRLVQEAQEVFDRLGLSNITALATDGTRDLMRYRNIVESPQRSRAAPLVRGGRSGRAAPRGRQRLRLWRLRNFPGCMPG